MSVHLKRLVFFFCLLCLGLGQGNRANAQDPEIIYHLFLSSVFYQHDPMKIFGRVVLLADNGIGVPDVVIYSAEPFPANGIDSETKYVPVAETDGKGNYVFTPEDDRWYYLIPRKNGYQFSPEASTVSRHNFLFGNFAAYWFRDISGRVTDSNGSGIAYVGIYDNNIKLAETDIQGYYKAALPPNEYTLTPQKSGYLFTPQVRYIPADQSNHGNQDFTAQTVVTISGNLTWKNISDDTTIQSNPLPGENNLTVPAITVALDACPQDGSTCTRIVANPDGTYSLPVPYNWSGSVKPSSLGFEFSPERLTYSSLKVNKTQQNFQAPLSPGGTVYPVSVSVKNQDGDLLPYDSRILIRLDGTNHAAGSRYRYATTPENSTWPFYKTEWTFSSIPSGWIGDIIPVSSAYTFSPASVRLEGLVTEGRTVDFTATPLDPIVFSGTIIWEYEWDRTRPLPTVEIFAVARDGAPFSYKVVTGADGKYSIPLPYYWSGSVTPASAGFLFNPATTTINNLSVDHEQNFWVRDTP